MKLNRHYNWVFKFAIVILLMGLAFRLLFNQSSPQLDNPFVDTAEISRTPVSLVQSPPPVVVIDDVPKGTSVVADDALKETSAVVDDALKKTSVVADDAPKGTIVVADDIMNEPPVPAPQPFPSLEEKCDLFTGDWIPNPSGPIYTNASCPLIEGHQNCMRNGRPDSGYLFWRWNPRNCELPPFDAQRFLELMRDKTWALIGDSISRNHVQSLLCMLSTVEMAVEVYHDKDYKSKRWFFPSYNLTISNIWSPFLVKADIFEDNNGVSLAEVQLQLDKLDKSWSDDFSSFDYAIISTGKWFLKAAVYHENDTAVGCHICPEGMNVTEVGFVFAYERALRYAMDFIATANRKGMIFFRTSTPDHFENGEWHNGGTCPRLSPAKEDEIGMKDILRILRDVELAQFKNASAKAAADGVNLRLLDFTNLLLPRPDGHPGPYRQFQPFAEDKNATVQNDCLHWCLPGPIDNMNDIIMEVAVNV